jgi:hypothetical protein
MMMTKISMSMSRQVCWALGLPLGCPQCGQVRALDEIMAPQSLHAINDGVVACSEFCKRGGSARREGGGSP